jgi:hypothetical protein
VSFDKISGANSKFLFRGMNFKENTVIPSFFLEKPLRLIPGEKATEISFGKIKAEIYAVFLFEPGQTKPKTHHQKFRFVIEADGVKVRFEPPGTDSVIHEITWIGDLNADGFPDIFTGATADSHCPSYLMVSKRSGKNVEMTESGMSGSR